MWRLQERPEFKEKFPQAVPAEEEEAPSLTFRFNRPGGDEQQR